MGNKDRKSFMEVLISTGELYEKHISDTLMELYFNILSPYSIEDIKRGISGHIRDKKSGQFFPKPADIIRALEGSDDCLSMAKWCEVRKAIQKHGAYKSVTFDDPVIMTCIDRMGGWVAVASVLTSEIGYREQEFMTLYARYSKFPVEDVPKYLPGIIEVSNRQFGADEIPEPILISTGAKQLEEGK